MKTCTKCGTMLHDNDAFCHNCGSAGFAGQDEKKQAISIGGWIGRSLIPCIPLVGAIVYLIMLFIWSGDAKKEDTFRNWAKAQLIIIAVVLVLSILSVVLFGSAFAELLESMA